MLGQHLASPGEHFFPEGEIRLSPGVVRLPPIQGLLLRFKFLLGEGGVTGLALELLLPLSHPLHGLDLLDLLGFHSLVQGVQLGLVFCCEGLPLGQGLHPPSHLLLSLGRLQLPSAHLLELPLVLLVVSLELGSLEDELAGRRLGASSSWERKSLRHWCSASSASHTCKIASPVSLRTWWGRDSIRGTGTGTASCSAPDRSHRPNTTSISYRAGGGLELDAPPASPPVSEGGTDPLAGASSAAATPPDVDVAAAGSSDGAWEATDAVLAAARGGSPAPLPADACY
jgi:hypothetical protein